MARADDDLGLRGAVAIHHTTHCGKAIAILGAAETPILPPMWPDRLLKRTRKI
jgi:hypothetical protein